jgi:HPt (histidine-containing phosphotransfer) domain-containing protein
MVGSDEITRADGFDDGMLRELADLIGPDGIAAALDTFDADLRQGVAGLESALAAQDAAALRRHAHRVRGLLMQFGAIAAGGRAAAIESAPDGEALAACPGLVAAMPGVAARLRAMAARLAAQG